MRSDKLIDRVLFNIDATIAPEDQVFNYRESNRYVDREFEGTARFKYLIKIDLTSVVKLLEKNIYFNFRYTEQFKSIDIDPIPVSSERMPSWLNIRVIQLSNASTVLIGYVSRHKKGTYPKTRTFSI